MRMSYLAAPAFLAIASIVAGCSGRGTGSPIPQSGAGTPVTSPAQPSTARFTILIPAATTSSGSKAPQYVSPNTQSASIIETDAGATPRPAVTVNLTPASPGCTAGTGGTTCAITVAANVGTDTFAVTTFDGLAGAGHQLSSGTLTATIASATANTTVPLVLGGIVSSLSIAIADPFAPLGTSTTLALQAKDASGATIIGTYDHPIGLTTGSGATLGKTTVANTTDAADVGVRYNGIPSGPITLGASVDGQSATATLTPGSGVLYYTLGSDPAVDGIGFPIISAPDGKIYYGTLGPVVCPNNSPCTSTNGAIGQLDPATGHFSEIALHAEAVGLFATADGAIWIAEGSSGEVARVAPGNFTASGVTQIPIPKVGYAPSSFPRAFALGSDGNLWFTDQYGHRLGKIDPTGPYTSAAVSFYPIPNGTATFGARATPVGIVSGSDGNLYVADSTNGLIDQMSVGGALLHQFVTPEQQGGVSNYLQSFPRFLAVGPDNRVYVTQSGIHGATYPYTGFLDGMTLAGAFTPASLPGIYTEPDSIVAGSDRLYFSDLGNDGLGFLTPGSGRVREIPLADGITWQFGKVPNGVAVAADGTPWFMCYGSANAPLCAGRVVLNGTWSVFPGRTIDVLGAGIQAGAFMGIAESGDAGPFTFATSNPAIAQVADNADHNFTIVGYGAGTCVITVTDAHGRSVTVNVNVTTTSGTVQKTAIHRGIF